jgi:hypothetical protein
LVIFERGLILCPGWPGLLSYIGGMTGACHHARPLVEITSGERFAQAGLDCHPLDLHFPRLQASATLLAFHLSLFHWLISLNKMSSRLSHIVIIYQNFLFMQIKIPSHPSQNC